MSFFDLLSGTIAGGCQKERLAMTKVGGLRVSTIVSDDMGPETAILDANGAHPVERYEDKASALKGHEIWVAKAPTLRTVTKLGYGDLVDDRVIHLERVS